MFNNVKRLFVEKKEEFAVEAMGLLGDLRDNLGIKGLEGLRIINRYDIEGLTDEEFARAKHTVFSEPPVDIIYEEEINFSKECRVFAMEYLPGQFDQRADSAAQCVQILTGGEKPLVRVAKLIALSGVISDEEFEKIKSYCINPLESREASMKKPVRLDLSYDEPEKVEILYGFIDKSEQELKEYHKEAGFAMGFADLKFCQEYFREKEKRNPTVTELKVIDTYWSDHCRHTTFNTRLENIKFEEGSICKVIEKAYREYLKSREFVYGDKEKDISLMDIATVVAKEFRKSGNLDDMEISEENNACSIIVNAEVDGRNEEWLVMFKNETHNHPTEIEPFGGAATCLGGAIRDPLSGRAYVYGAMRLTGSGDPRAKVEDTIPGKLPQRKITTGAAAGYSSYGNQIGLAAGQIAEVYDEGFIAKRMEIGAVIAAAPRENVIRHTPEEGDVIILLGGRTGRDGCGGATGSSKEHTEESLTSCGAEVQKGNPPEERKIQRLFRKSEVTKLIKKCNDFGAGGVSVAIGELAEGLDINLDAILKKYEGLDGTELAISESQERMAVVVAAKDAEKFIKEAALENLEAVQVAAVTGLRRLRMFWRGDKIVDIDRSFLDTNGVKTSAEVFVKEPEKDKNYFLSMSKEVEENTDNLEEAWIANLKDINVCSQKGLVERFDSTIGTGTVLMPFGGKYQATPSEGLYMKLPVVEGETNTATIMTYGYNPKIANWSPFHGAVYAVLESAAKVAALGGNYENIRLTLQEYFEKLGKDPAKWGKPFAALLGAYMAQKELGIPAIGGKDSMSGTFNDLNVPPTLAAFAVNVSDARRAVSQEFKKPGSFVVLLETPMDENNLPDFKMLRNNLKKVSELVTAKKVLGSSVVKFGGIAASISKMCFGNRIGFRFNHEIESGSLFNKYYCSIILEIDSESNLDVLFEGTDYVLLGYTADEPNIEVNRIKIDLNKAFEAWESTLEKVFPQKVSMNMEKPKTISFEGRNITKSRSKYAKPRVFIPVFPGTNCEYDTARAFEKAGAKVEILPIRNMNPEVLEQSIKAMAEIIKNSQIIALPGGFSGGDEPDGSGKFIATAFRNPRIKEAVEGLLKNRDGLMLGICNGFQALIKLGLLPYGEICDITENSPTLTYNKIGRHVSCMSRTRIASNLSPWLSKVKVGDIHIIPISHGEGRFVATKEEIEKLIKNGQIATQYVDVDGNATYEMPHNPNGSLMAVEGITSPDGRILGKMGHSERVGTNIAVNVPGEKDQKIFEAGVEYFI